MSFVTLSIPENFKDYIGNAVLRFQYLHPKAKIDVRGLEIIVEENEETDFKQEILHLIYKEKIYTETLDIRHSLFRRIADA
jgi:hypothetical protein